MTRVTIRTILLALLLLAVAPSMVRAADVVHLDNGGLVAGKVTCGVFDVRVETAVGAVTIPWNRIASIDRASYVERLYRKRAAALKKNDVRGRFALALWCRRHGLTRRMRSQLRAILAVDPNHAAARAALGYGKVNGKWVAGPAELEAKGFVRRGGRWILAEEAEYSKALSSRRRPLDTAEKRTAELIAKASSASPKVRRYARQVLAAMSWKDARVPLFRALVDRRPKERILAADELGARRRREAIRPLVRTAVLDTDESVRRQATKSLREMRIPGILDPFLRALASDHETVRVNAAEALGDLGDPRAIQFLVRRLELRWGPGTRVNLRVTNQVSYVRDFNVEVAQASAVGDPVVGIVDSGVILDVRVLGASEEITVVERRALDHAIAELRRDRAKKAARSGK